MRTHVPCLVHFLSQRLKYRASAIFRLEEVKVVFDSFEIFICDNARFQIS